ncbi:hypothetical protein B296_00023168 [Ensete ventricosum]|uniref:Uncharacterized protein n=1 Tax=Ensete ventricosum TaxID=4639 RepID=A0A427ABP1_ENSVE|nr:hypothetical protein B296_00023168 [Ensete ventricosum]
MAAHRRAKATINKGGESSYLHEVIPSAMQTQRAGAAPSLWNSRVSPIGLVSRTRRFMAFSDQFRFTVIRSITSNTFLKSWVHVDLGVGGTHKRTFSFETSGSPLLRSMNFGVVGGGN